jgi:OPT oligopeptide transporter protein
MPQPASRRSALPIDLSFGATDKATSRCRSPASKGTSEEIERQWYEQVYRGRGDSMAQLTWRAVLMGSCLGAVMSLTNLYIGLKAGWGFGVAITACILSYAIWTSLLKVGIAHTPMTILENNSMQSTATSAGG